MYTNNAGHSFEIVSNLGGKSRLIKFTRTGSVRKANIDNIRAGKVKDLYEPSRYGVGFDGEFKRYPYWRRAKDLWSNMLKRCYCEADTKGYFGEVVVDPRWHSFANFLDDLKTLAGFQDWLDNKGMQLDKDLIGNGSVYSVHTCMFLTAHHNKSIQPNYRTGKVFNKESRRWV